MDNNIAFKEDFHGKIDSLSIDLAQKEGFCCGSSEERIKEWQKAHKIGSKIFQKLRKEQKNTARIEKSLEDVNLDRRK
jgi:hypothetical protein